MSLTNFAFKKEYKRLENLNLQNFYHEHTTNEEHHQPGFAAHLH
ncbi:hypothetical protein [Methanococcoides burtonii]|nr:hypothetical protein [Methanococcoides burtonii]